MPTRERPKSSEVQTPGNVATQVQKAVSPKSARIMIQGRRLPSNMYRPRKKTAPKGNVIASTVKSAAPGFASNTVQGAGDIVELARALKHDVDLIFEFVYNNIEFLPNFGSHKGPSGTVCDGMGNSFDQSDLMIALLRESGYECDFQFGDLLLTEEQLIAWLGVESVWAAYNMLARTGCPCDVVYNEGTFYWDLRLSHCWVKVTIDATDYVFDPSMKSYTVINGIDVGDAISYDQGEFMTDAVDGATVTSDYIEDLNRTNIRGNLATLTGNLLDYLKTNMPTATLDDVIGGRKIIPVVGPVRQTDLPYLEPLTSPDTWADIPDPYKATLSVLYDDPNIDVSFFSRDIHGKRLTLTFNGSHECELRLDGDLLATSDAQIPDSWNSVLLTVTHPFPNPWWDQSFWQTVFEGNPYLIAHGWGNAGRQMVEVHRKKLSQFLFDGDPATDENVIGETLAVWFHMWNAEKSWAANIFNRMTGCTTVLQHQLGLVGHRNTPVMDLGGILWSSGALDNNYDNCNTNDTSLSMHGIAFEAGSIEQICGIGGISTTSIIDKAIENGLKVYDAQTSNWSTVRPNLTNYDSQTLDDVENWYLNWDWRAVLPEDGAIDINDFEGWGYYAIPPSPGWGAVGIFSGFLQGGMGSEAQTQGETAEEAEENDVDPESILYSKFANPTSEEPIDLVNGNYLSSNTDLVVGSGQFPYSLSFHRSYNSGKRLQNGPLGLGWTHNWNQTVTKNSDGLLAMGWESPFSGAAGLVSMFVTADLYGDLAKPFDKWITVAVANRWLLDQSKGNTAIVELSSDTQVFTRLPDGSYAPPLGNTATLVEGVGDWTYTNKHGVVTTFNGDGQISEIQFPFGVTVTCAYSTGKLDTVNNGMGRELSFNFNGDVLETVSSNASQEVGFAYDVDGNLETVTDLDEEDTVYVYDIPGRMTQMFRPANPLDAIVTNVYDSLGRVMTQTDGSSNIWTYFIAGPRSEEQDPEENSRVLYVDRNGRVIREINALGDEIVNEFDGLGRLSSTTMPEGNKREFVYDEFNNVLTITDIPKDGSGLSNVVQTFEYDLLWNRVATAEDGRENVTTFTHDEVTGQLLAIAYPEVDSVVATVEMAYNGRGQLISRIDQSGMQTQSSYDDTSEVLESVVVNTNWKATIGGTATVSDVLTITATDAGIGGGSKGKSYTVQTGDDLADIATGLADAINADTELAGLNITAKAIGSDVFLSTSPGNGTTFSQSTSGGATATITLSGGLELTTLFGYDSVGNVDETTDARGNSTGFEWDAMRRLKVITPPAPFEEQLTNYSYDENGNRTKIERYLGLDPFDEPIWQTTIATYTVDNQLATVTDPEANVTTLTYNSLRKLWKREDDAARVTEFGYDEVVRLATVTDPASVVAETRTYTVNGLLATVEDANENVTTFEYDGLDRLKKQIYADSTFEQFTRDANGNIEVKLTRAGDTINFAFDPLNRLIEKDPDNLPTVSYVYDLANRLISLSTPPVGGDPGSGEFEYCFDTAGRLVSEKYPDAKVVGYELDQNGNVTKVTWPDSYYVERICDEINRLEAIKLNGSGTPAVEFGYDLISRRTSLTYENGSSCAYGYRLDNLMTDLTQTFDGSSVAFTYGFNNVRELESQSVDDSAFMWHPVSPNTVAYDPANALNQYPEVDSLAFSYNNNGCLTDDGVWTFGYDTENRLISADDGVTSAAYLYDPQNRQAQKEVESVKTRFIYSGFQRIADYDGSDALIARYVYGTGLDEPLIIVDSGNDKTYVHHDRTGSVIAITDDGGIVDSTYNYSPWGESVSLAGTTFGFTGQRFDEETGLYYFKNRSYSTKLGRFLQPDPIGYVDGLNLYQHGFNNPNSFSDPMGLSSGWGGNQWESGEGLWTGNNVGGAGAGWGGNQWGGGDGWGGNQWGAGKSSSGNQTGGGATSLPPLNIGFHTNDPASQSNPTGGRASSGGPGVTEFDWSTPQPPPDITIIWQYGPVPTSSPAAGSGPANGAPGSSPATSVPPSVAFPPGFTFSPPSHGPGPTLNVPSEFPNFGSGDLMPFNDWAIGVGTALGNGFAELGPALLKYFSNQAAKAGRGGP